MPRYEYKCNECGKSFEITHGIDDNVESCEFCGGGVRRLFHPVGIVFKGSGFYSTDSRSASKKHHSAHTEDTGDEVKRAKDNGGQDKKEDKANSSDGSVKASS